MVDELKIAILGAGFAGVATAWYLSQRPDIHIDVFDHSGIGGGASGIAAGLLHPYSGLHAKLNWQGNEGLCATQELLNVSAAALKRPVSKNTGLLRLCLTKTAVADYTDCAAKHRDVKWLDHAQCQAIAPGCADAPGIFISQACTVYTELYLAGLFQASRAHLINQSIHSLDELDAYDKIVVTLGAASASFPETKDLRLFPVKGQLLELEWPSSAADLVIPLNAQAYLIKHPVRNTCIIGATYERGIDSREPDAAFAISDILPKAIALFPSLRGMKVLDCKAGTRASTPDHRPILKQINSKCWVLAGMGSKGLLYHALFAQKLANLMAD